MGKTFDTVIIFYYIVSIINEVKNEGEGNMKISKKISVITLAALFSLLFAMTAFGATGKVTGLKQEKASTNTVSIAWDNYLELM